MKARPHAPYRSRKNMKRALGVRQRSQPTGSMKDNGLMATLAGMLGRTGGDR